WIARPVVRRLVGEHKRLVARLNAKLLHRVLVSRAVLLQNLDGRRVERHSAHTVRLGVLLERATGGANIVAAHGDVPGGEVHVAPAQREHLGAPHAGHHDQPNQRSPRLVLTPRRVDDPGCLLDCRRGRLRRWLPRLARYLGRVRIDPLPPDRGRERAAEHEVNLRDRRVAQWPALVRTALQDLAAGLGTVVRRIATSGRAAWRSAVPDLAALVLAVDAVLDERPTVAPRPAPAKLGVELLEHAG